MRLYIILKNILTRIINLYSKIGDTTTITDCTSYLTTINTNYENLMKKTGSIIYKIEQLDTYLYPNVDSFKLFSVAALPAKLGVPEDEFDINKLSIFVMNPNANTSSSSPHSSLHFEGVSYHTTSSTISGESTTVYITGPNVMLLTGGNSTAGEVAINLLYVYNSGGN